MTCGIYRIRNIETGDEYIGSSRQIEVRFEQHRRYLRLDEHYNPHLQSAWNKYSEDAFVFEVVEVTDEVSRHVREQTYLDPKPHYNIAIDVGHPATHRGIKRGPRPDSVRTKISASKMGHSVSKSTRDKLRAAQLGRVQSDETRAKKSAALKRAWELKRLQGVDS